MSNELHPLLQAYYTEVDPGKRRKILEEYDAAADAGLSGRTGEKPAGGPVGARTSAEADAYRRDLYAARHFDKKQGSQQPDHFLWNLMNLCTIFKSPGIFPKWHKKEVRSLLRKMQLDERPLRDKTCEAALYWEFRNVVHRYYVTCEDSTYGRAFFGMVPANNEKRAVLCCTDIWGFSYGIAQMVGLEEDMALLCRAANDEYCALVPEAASLDEEYRKYNKKG